MTNPASLSTGGIIRANRVKHQLFESVSMPRGEVSNVTMGTNPATCTSASQQQSFLLMLTASSRFSGVWLRCWAETAF